MLHYVYALQGADERWYIGARSFENPEEDYGYWGSNTDQTFLPIIKYILAIFETRQEANNFEHFLLKGFRSDLSSKFANLNISSPSGLCSFSYGYKHTSKAKKNYKKANTGKNVNKKRTKKTKETISNSMKKFWGENYDYMHSKVSNRTVTEEGKRKRREKAKARKENGYRQASERKYLFLSDKQKLYEIYLSDVHNFGLTKSAICNLINHPEKHKSHKGWKVIGCII